MQCAPCLAEPPQHDGISAATLYNDTSRKLILTLKHGHKIALSTMMGTLMAAKIPATHNNPVLVPVPLHRWRIWQRGFNQAALLSRQISETTGHEIILDALLRTKATTPLGGLGKRARAEVLAGAIVANPRHRKRLAGRHVILVDDVLTSGATSATCVRALRKAGAASVRIACFARVLDEAKGQSPGNETPEVGRTPGAA